MTITGKNGIMICGPKDGGTYVIEFRTADGESLAISIPRTETAVIKHFQEWMPCLRAHRWCAIVQIGSAGGAPR